MYHPFSVTETLSIAWHVLKRNFATIAVYSLISVVLLFGVGLLVKFIFVDLVLATAGTIFSLILFSFIFLGFIKLVFQLIDKEYYDFGFGDIVPTTSYARLVTSVQMLLDLVVLGAVVRIVLFAARRRIDS